MARKLFFTFLLISYLLAIEKSAAEKKIDIIAHRGASSIAPENTLLSFSKAIEIKVDYLELDVHVSKDDSLIVIHDNSVDRTTNGSGLVKDLTYQELKALDAGYYSKFGNMFSGEKIPTLFEVLALAKGKVKVAIELKADIEEKVISLIEKTEMVDDACIQSYSLARLTNVKSRNPSLPVLFLASVITKKDIDELYDIKGEYVGGEFLITSSLIEYAHQKGIKICKFTVNDPTAMKELTDIDIDGIITDYPQSLFILNRVQLNVFPNPVIKTTSIQIVNWDKTGNIFVYDMGGNIVHTMKNIDMGSVVSWEPSIKSNGIYFIGFEAEGVWVSRKIIYAHN